MSVRNWDYAASVYLDGVWGRPFAWGTTDCVSILREILRCRYGTDPAKGLGLTYKTVGGAVKAAKRWDIVETLRARGCVDATRARRYDILVFPDPALRGDGVSVVLPQRTRYLAQIGAPILRVPYAQGSAPATILRPPEVWHVG